jgi:oligoendopeptidase F
MNRICSLVRTAALALLLGMVGAAAGPRFTPDANMPREKIPNEYKWDLSVLLEDDDAFAPTLASVSADRERLREYRGKLSSPRSLRECLDLYFKVRLATNRLTLYAHLRFETYLESTELQAMNDTALRAMNELMAEASFIRQEILALDDEAMRAAYEKEPKLAEYRPYIEEIRRRRDRVLDAEAERILSLFGDNLWAEIDLNELPSDFEKTFGSALTDLPLPMITDENGEQVQLAFANYPRFRRSSDRRVRREAVEGMFGALRSHEHVFAGLLGGQANLTIALARARGYDTALEAYLRKDDIDPAVYTSLIDAIRANVKPLHRYVELRRKVLGLDEVHIYDLYTPLVPSAEMVVSYDEARSILPQALAPLGKDYVKVLAQGLDPANGWIDLYPHQHKESGAFSASVYGVHPFVKMNFFNDSDGLATLAHEYGHSLHTYLSMTNQPYITADYASFIAEIASTCNEKLLLDYQLQHADSKEQKLALLGDLVENIRTTIYRQALFAEFELKLHEAAEAGVPITASLLDDMYTDLIRTYYGPDFVIDENDGMEWAYVGHFYYKFYMYTYATGLSSGIAIAEKLQSGEKGALDAYLGMLKRGSSKPPLELLKGAGVDLTRPDAVEAAARLMDRTLSEMEKLLGSG